MAKILACRACQGTHLKPVLDLGKTPLANALRTSDALDAPPDTFPLVLVRCPACSLVQIDETVPPQRLFSEYLYFSSFSDTMVEHARTLSQEVIAHQGLNDAHLVMEVASNDGYLLQHYKAQGVGVLGIEPAANIAAVAEREKGIPTRSEFFGLELARTLVAEGLKADVMHAHNVLAHVPDLPGFVAGFAELLNPGGLAIFEFPYLIDMIEKLEFDTIYHEHLCYFSLTALQNLMRAQGLEVVRARRVAIHGGSLQLWAMPAESATAPDTSVAKLLEEERSWGVNDATPYERFATRVKALKAQLTALLQELKSSGASIAAYGASAKGSTLVSYCGIDHTTLDFVADRSTYKQGLYLPGIDVPIRPPSVLLEEKPDYTLLLTWNFAREILRQQSRYIEQGGRFVLPLPEPHVMEPSA